MRLFKKKRNLFSCQGMKNVYPVGPNKLLHTWDKNLFEILYEIYFLLIAALSFVKLIKIRARNTPKVML